MNEDVNDVNVEVKDVEFDVNMEVNEESKTDPDYNTSNEEDEYGGDDDNNVYDLNPDVDWTTLLPNKPTKQYSKHNVIFDNENFDSNELHSLLENGIEYILCVKNLYDNWRNKYHGIEIKEAL